MNDNAKRKDKDKSLNKRITDDIKATDYTIDPSWKPSHGWVSDKKEGERIHKRLAHITTARLTLNDQWYPDAMEWQALKTFEEFVAVISASEQQWFTKATEIINQRQPKVLATLGESSGTQTVNRYPIDLTTFRFK